MNTTKQSVTTAASRLLKNTPTPDIGLVSVIIPCYDQAHFLREAIESALGQTYPHREVLVVDDGSTDTTAQVAAAYPAIHYIRQENSGVSAARNAGLKQSRGEYLVFLDADDRLLPRALEIGVDSLRQHSACAFASGYCRIIAADGSLLADHEPRRISSEHYLGLLRGNYIWCPASVIYRRSTFDSVTGFDPSLGPCADYDLYLRISRFSPIFCHNQFVVEYRFHGSNMSVDHSRMLREALQALDMQWDFVKGNSQRTDAFMAGKKHWQDYYGVLQLSNRILEVVQTSLPADATVAVAAGGRRALLRLGNCRVWHFPQATNDKRGKLFQQGAKGSAEVRWIQPGMRYELRLFGGAQCSKELAAISVIGVANESGKVAAEPFTSDNACLIATPNPVVVSNQYAGRTTISWNTGNGSEGRLYVSEGGEYDSRRPRDDEEAISCLEAIRAQGAQYLLLPATAFWWLDNYQKFREYVETRYPVVVRDNETCIIFDLRRSPVEGTSLSKVSS
jgi:glycosyltransferase involved in cell wall biosynthesis